MDRKSMPLFRHLLMLAYFVTSLWICSASVQLLLHWPEGTVMAFVNPNYYWTGFIMWILLAALPICLLGIWRRSLLACYLYLVVLSYITAFQVYWNFVFPFPIQMGTSRGEGIFVLALWLIVAVVPIPLFFRWSHCLRERLEPLAHPPARWIAGAAAFLLFLLFHQMSVTKPMAAGGHIERGLWEYGQGRTRSAERHLRKARNMGAAEWGWTGRWLVVLQQIDSARDQGRGGMEESP